MRDSEPIDLFGTGRKPAYRPSLKRPAGKRHHGRTAFSRYELNEILGLYGQKVAAGEWRDYAIDALKEKAVFSIFRNSCEMPLYRIVKHTRSTRKSGTYAVITPTGLILRCGQSLTQVLKAIESGPRLVTA